MASKKTKSQAKATTTKQPQKQNELIVVMIISLILGLGGGYLLGANLSNDSTGSENTITKTQKMDPHSHSSLYEVPAENAPKVELEVNEDAKSGYNIKIITTNFVFTPENVNGENVAGEGHAHIYLDGEKLSRVYGPYYHYSGNFEGTKTFKVTLNANDHSDYAVDGVVIEAEKTVTHDSSDPAHNEMHSDEMTKPGENKHSEEHMHSEM